MNKKINFKTLLICIAIPLLVGGIAPLLTTGSMKDFDALNKPPLSPPGWLFPVVWTILYTLMGIASYFVVETPSSPRDTRDSLRIYFIQLAFNFLWSIIFFTLGAYEIAFLWLVALLTLIIACTVRFYRVSKVAGIIMIPYILWVSFAGYLNLAIAYMN